MKNKKNLIIYLIIFILVSILVSEFLYWMLFKNKIKNSEEIEITEEMINIDVEYSDEELVGLEGKSYTSTINLNEEEIKSDGEGVKISKNTIRITKSGNYYITGSSSNCAIIIDANKKDDVGIVFDNVNIESKTTSVINGVSCNKLTITLAKDSVNYLKDNSNYTEFTNNKKTEPDSTIFSKTDLIINGTGKLVINSNYKDSIASKDTLKIINTEIEINSVDNGIRGKDFVAINDANITINSQGIGIKSTNTDDKNLGYIVIDSGTFTINSVGDSIHSNGSTIINGGTFTIESGDDGIHAETCLVINDGNIDVIKSYEGLEGSYIEINNGNISTISSDDGINVAGGNDNSYMNKGFQGQNDIISTTQSSKKLIINNGTINVNATGDGLDSNGSIYINGGTIIIAGPSSGANGALDYDSECVVNGGNLVAYGTTEMWQNPSNNSQIYTVAFLNTGKKSDVLSLKNESGQEIAGFTAEKSYSGILFSNENIKKDETYTLYINGNSVGSLTASNVITSNISNSSNFDGMDNMQLKKRMNGMRR